MPNLPPDAVPRSTPTKTRWSPCPEAAEAIRQRSFHKAAGISITRRSLSSAQMAESRTGVARRPRLMPFAGSSDPLHRAVLAFTGREKSYVVADPGYEAGTRAAHFIGAKTVSVPLRKDYAHDVSAMAQADPDAGLIYVCNPNNPTGSITPREDIEFLVANKPKDLPIILLDEAYIHLSKTAQPASKSGRRMARMSSFCGHSQALQYGGPPGPARLSGRPDLLAKLPRLWCGGHCPSPA